MYFLCNIAYFPSKVPPVKYFFPHLISYSTLVCCRHSSIKYGGILQESYNNMPDYLLSTDVNTYIINLMRLVLENLKFLLMHHARAQN